MASLRDSELYDKYMAAFHEEQKKESVESLIVKLADVIDTFIYARREGKLGNVALMNKIELENKPLFDEVMAKIVGRFR